MNTRTSFTLAAAAAACLTGVGVILAVHSDADAPVRPTDFHSRFQPALPPDAHIGNVKNLKPVPLDDRVHPGSARKSYQTTEGRRHGHAQPHP